MDKRKIKKSLKIFAQRAKKNLRADKVILFGSYAVDKANSYSDVDVVVLSNIFAKIPQDKRLDILYPLTRGLSPDFHPFGFTSKEFSQNVPSSILSEVRSTGVVVA